MNYYGIYDRPTIGDVVASFNTEELHAVREEAEKAAGVPLRWCGGGTIRGYCNANTAVMLDYNGRYGKGYAVLSPAYYYDKRSKNYMDISYLIPA